MNLINIANDLAIVLMLSLFSMGVSFFLDFCFGLPGRDSREGNDLNVHSIFFGWILFLSKRRLRMYKVEDGSQNILQQLERDYYEGLNSDNPITRKNNKNALNISITMNAKEFITWEYAVGFCVFCTNVWITLLFSIGIIFIAPPVLFVLPLYFLPLPTIIFSHLLLRKIN